MNKIGAHYSIQEILNGETNTDYVQFCTGSPMTVRRSLDIETRMKLNEALRNNYETNKNVIHAAYTINLCNKDYNSWTIPYLVHEVTMCEYLNVKYLVIHGGSLHSKDKDIPYHEAIDNFAYCIKEIADRTENQNDVILCLETMPGKSNQFLSNLKQFRDLFDVLHSMMGENFNKRVGVCFDTCHFYDSVNGEDFDNITTELYRNWFETFIKVVHLNNSSLKDGKYKDRHRNIIEGVIPSETLAKIYTYYSSKGIPVILETPQDGYEGDIKFIRDQEMLVE